MQIFVGLGNPGNKYSKNRHNIGFMALNRISDKLGFSPWKAKFQGHMCEGLLGNEKVVLLKPETFMNLSGQSVGETMRFFKLEPQDVTVFHDELDLPSGKLRIKTGGGHAGHNGLRSIHEYIGPDYHRVRLGIGHPGSKNLVSGYVLHDFAKSDQYWLEAMLEGIAQGALKLASGDKGGFMNQVALHRTEASASRKKQPKGGGKRIALPNLEASTTLNGDGRTKIQKLLDRFK